MFQGWWNEFRFRCNPPFTNLISWTLWLTAFCNLIFGQRGQPFCIIEFSLSFQNKAFLSQIFDIVRDFVEQIIFIFEFILLIIKSASHMWRIQILVSLLQLKKSMSAKVCIVLFLLFRFATYWTLLPSVHSVLLNPY